jgi:hypothetical protein
MADSMVDRFKNWVAPKRVSSPAGGARRKKQIDDALEPVKESNETQERRDMRLRELEDKAGAPKPYKKGGSVTRGDGCVSKGKTRGRMV